MEPTEAASPLPDTHSSCRHHQHASPHFCLLSLPAQPVATSAPKPTLLMQSWDPHAGAAPHPARSAQTLRTPCRRWHSLLAAAPHVSWRRQLSVWPVGHSQPPRAGCTRGRLVRAQNAIPDTEGVRRTGRVEARCVRGSEEGGVQQAQAPGEARQGGRQRQPGRQEAG